MADINALPQTPAFVVHTGDVSHLSKPEEFGQARELLQELRVDRVHAIPGEHDTIDDGVTGCQVFRSRQKRQGLLQLRPQRRALPRAQQRAQLQGGHDGLARRRADRVGDERPRARLAFDPDRGARAIPLWTIWKPWGWAPRMPRK